MGAAPSDEASGASADAAGATAAVGGTPTAAATVQQLDLGGLAGRVLASSAAASDYFGHFCTLIHLEFLEEVLEVRRRLHSCTYARMRAPTYV